MDKKQWFRDRKWGVFNHYLNSLQNNPDSFNSDGQCSDWNGCVEALDTDRMARQLHEVNAGYLVFTVMQGTRFMIAPNETYDRLTGFEPGFACSRRDLIRDLINSLAKYDIPLFLYFTGDGPIRDPDTDAGKIFNTPNYTDGKAAPDFVEKWTAVLREYSLRYGTGIKGWWVDGLFNVMYPGRDNPFIGQYKEAALAGNPDALFSANYYGVCDHVQTRDIGKYKNVIFGEFFHEIQPPTDFCDYTAGEANAFDLYPDAPDYNGAVSHVLSFLGIPKIPVMVYDGWGKPGSKYSAEYMRGYVECVNSIGGVVSVDCCLHRDGHYEEDQLKVLRALSDLRS